MQVRAWWRRSRLRHWLVMNDERIGAWPFAAIIVVSVAALLLGAVLRSLLPTRTRGLC